MSRRCNDPEICGKLQDVLSEFNSTRMLQDVAYTGDRKATANNLMKVHLVVAKACLPVPLISPFHAPVKYHSRDRSRICTSLSSNYRYQIS